MSKLVNENPNTLRKLVLQLNGQNQSKLQDAKLQLSRQYRAAEVTFKDFSKTTALWITSHFCLKLRVIHFMGVNLNAADAKIFCKTLQSLQELDTLTMFLCDLRGYSDEGILKIDGALVPKLKEIRLLTSHLGVGI